MKFVSLADVLHILIKMRKLNIISEDTIALRVPMTGIKNSKFSTECTAQPTAHPYFCQQERILQFLKVNISFNNKPRNLKEIQRLELGQT